MTSPEPPPGMYRLDTELSTRDYLGEMWNRREFAVALPVEQLRVSHQDSLLGNLWHLTNPLLSVAVFYVIFGVILGTDRGVDHFVLWLMTGVFAYQLTSSAVVQGSRAVTGNAGLMRAIRFPRALLPISSVLSNLLHFGFELAIVAGGALVMGVGLNQRWLLLPAVIAMHSALNLGGAFIAARLNDSFSDVEQVIPFIFRLLMYLTGVMFPLRHYVDSESPAAAQLVVKANPLVAILDLYRWVVLGTPVDTAGVVRAAVFAVVLLAFGFRFFRAGERRYGLH